MMSFPAGMRCSVRAGRVRDDRGFSLVELMTVLLLLAVLVLTAIPLYLSATGRAEQKTCFQNQNTLERAAQVYLGAHVDHSSDDLIGVVNSAHPIVVENIVGTPPHCPSGAEPADPNNPTAAEGVYTFEESATLAPCALGATPHGNFQ